MKITLEEIYFMYIQMTVKINRWLKREYFAVLHIYNKYSCLKIHIFIFIQEDL